MLAPLDALEEDRREPLVQTLEALVAADLNVAAAARERGWHYNTVRYRIRGLTQLLGPFLEDGDLLQSLTLAMLIRRELAQAKGQVPPSAQTSRAA